MPSGKEPILNGILQSDLDLAGFDLLNPGGALGFDGVFSSLTGLPSTLAGYGISNGATTVNVNLPSAVFGAATGSSADHTITVAPALQTQVANKTFAGPTTGADAAPTFRSLVGADLPDPAAGTKGGVKSKTNASNQWINSIGTDGGPTSTQPAFSNLSGTAAINQGGTGQITANAALNALLPSQPGHAGEYLTTNGTDASFGAIVGTGGGTVTNTGTLTSGKVLIGNAGVDAKTSKVTLTDPATTATITITDNKTLAVSNSLTLAGPEASVQTFQATGTIVSRDSTDTLTNKTINASQLVDDSVSYAKIQNVSATSRLLGRASSGAGDTEEISLDGGFSISGTTLRPYNVSAAFTTSIDVATAKAFRQTLSADRIVTFSNFNDGDSIVVQVKQAAANSYTTTWPAAKWSGGAQPTMTATFDHYDIYTFVNVNGTIFASAVQNLY